MSSLGGIERRTQERFDKDAQAFIYFNYDFSARMDFSDQNNAERCQGDEKYPAFSKNISAEGLCFTALKKLHPGEQLQMDMYVGENTHPLHMEGEVRWSQSSRPGFEEQEGGLFNTGIKLFSINGQRVAESVRYDQEHHVIWSAVLDAVLGRVKEFVQSQQKEIGGLQGNAGA